GNGVRGKLSVAKLRGVRIAMTLRRPTALCRPAAAAPPKHASPRRTMFDVSAGPAGAPSDLPRDDEERAMIRRRLFPMTPQRPTHDPSPAPAAFVLCPVACLPAVPDATRLQQQALYEWAYRQAREVLKPSILERDLL